MSLSGLWRWEDSNLSIEWLRIRPWNGSQNHAFEELCCQLAQHAEVPAGSRYVRKGAPDAGVECFWILAGGAEWGWQAKFFLTAPTDGGARREFP